MTTLISYEAADAATHRVLAAIAGPDATPKADQLAAVRAVAADGARVLCVQATGWGKSLTYFAATAAVRSAGSGPVMVVSPLLALMRDQVDAAGRAGLTAASLSSANVDDWAAIEAALQRDEIDLLLVSPERLANPRFASTVLPTLLPTLGLLVIDEAHCVSDWGFDFRPDYQRIIRLLTSDAAARPSRLPVLATTATANGRVTADVAAQLGPDTVVLRGPLARDSLSLGVVPGLSSLERYAWVEGALRSLDGSGIVYALTVAESERLSDFLTSRGLDVAAYHGQLDTDARQVLEDRLRANEIKALVATSALGMGYDKPDLAFCIHVGSPASPVAYYQQVGRAGRALADAVAVLLPAESDEGIWRYFATANTPVPAHVDRLLDALGGADGGMSVPALESATGIRRGRIEATLKILAVDGAVERLGSSWSATGAPWRFDAAKYAALESARADEAGLMRSYAAAAGCLMAFLRQALDDVQDGGGGHCGRCSVCTGDLGAGLAHAPDPAVIEAARSFARGRDVILEPRKMWPSGVPGLRGRIAAAELAEAGRALAFADDPGWAELVLPLVADPSFGPPADSTVPDEVVDGLVQLLARWSRTWGARPLAVVPIPSRRRPQLVASTAERVATAGRLPLVEAFEPIGRAAPRDAASGARLSALAAGLVLRPGVPLPPGPVLLVDDFSATGWTLTLAAALLGRAGCGPALPLVLHRRP